MSEPSWVSIPRECEPSHAAATNETRPALTMGHIRHEEDGSYLYCTDSYILARVPITMHCENGERVAELPEVALGPEALRALDDAYEWRVTEGWLETKGRQVRYPVVADLGSPVDFAGLMDSIAKQRERDGQAALTHLAFNPQLLQRVVRAIGAGSSGVKVEFAQSRRAMTVVPLRAGAGIGLLMPMREA